MPLSQNLQQLMKRVSKARLDFGLTVSLKKTQVMGPDVESLPSVTISEYKPVIHNFVYLGSTIADNLSLDNELNRCIGNATTAPSRLTKRVWSNKKLTEQTKLWVYRACILSMALLDSGRMTGEKAERFPHALSPMHPQHHLAGQSTKQHSPGTSWNPKHVHTAETEAPALVRSCGWDGG